MTLENPGSSILCKYQSSLERNFLQSYNFLLSTFGRDTLTSKALCIVHLISKVTELINQLNIFVIVILIIISKFVKRHWKANSRASAYTNPRRIIVTVQRFVPITSRSRFTVECPRGD